MKPFIPAWLDEAGLSHAEFRLYCHLCRRSDKSGIAWPSADSISSDCRMARNTVWKVIKSLEAKGMILREGKPFQGQNRYRVIDQPIGVNHMPIDSTPTGANEIPIDESTIGAKEIRQSAQTNSRQSAQTNSREGYPDKVIQKKVIQKEELPFHSELFLTTWLSWKQHRKEKKKPLTPTTTDRQLKKLASLGEQAAIRWMDYAMEQGWQGLFEPPAQKQTPANRPTNEQFSYQKKGHAERPYD